MAKHRTEKRKSKKLPIIIGIIIIIFAVSAIFAYKKIKKEPEQANINNNTNKVEKYATIANDTTIENERLVMKSLFEYNTIIEYKFKDGTLDKFLIYEQFEDKEKLEKKKADYEKQKNIVIKNIDEGNLSIEIEKQEFGSDKNLSYEQIYNKYLVQIIGVYEMK